MHAETRHGRSVGDVEFQRHVHTVIQRHRLMLVILWRSSEGRQYDDGNRFMKLTDAHSAYNMQ